MHAMLMIPVITLALAGYVAVGSVGVSRLTAEGPPKEDYYANLQAHLERFEAAVHRYQVSHEGLAPPIVLADADGGLLRALGSELSTFGLPRYKQLAWRLVPSDATSFIGLCAESAAPLPMRGEAAFAKAARRLGWPTLQCGTSEFNIGFLVPLAPPPVEAPEAAPPSSTPVAATSGVTLPPNAQSAVAAAGSAAPDGPGTPPVALHAADAARQALIDAVAGQ